MTGQEKETPQLFGRSALVHSYRRLFDCPDGEIVLRHLIKKFHVLSSTMVVGDSHFTAMQEGERRVILSILRWARKDYAQIMADIDSQLNEREET